MTANNPNNSHAVTHSMLIAKTHSRSFLGDAHNGVENLTGKCDDGLVYGGSFFWRNTITKQRRWFPKIVPFKSQADYRIPDWIKFDKTWQSVYDVKFTKLSLVCKSLQVFQCWISFKGIHWVDSLSTNLGWIIRPDLIYPIISRFGNKWSKS